MRVSCPWAVAGEARLHRGRCRSIFPGSSAALVLMANAHMTKEGDG